MFLVTHRHGARVDTRAMGARLREARTDLGLSCNELDKRAGLGVCVTSKLERGLRKAPEWETLHKLALALGVRDEWLTQGIPPKRRGTTDALPRRTEAARLLQEDGFTAGAAIASVMGRPPRPGDDARSTLWWVDEIRHEARQR